MWRISDVLASWLGNPVKTLIASAGTVTQQWIPELQISNHGGDPELPWAIGSASLLVNHCLQLLFLGLVFLRLVGLRLLCLRLVGLRLLDLRLVGLRLVGLRLLGRLNGGKVEQLTAIVQQPIHLIQAGQLV